MSSSRRYYYLSDATHRKYIAAGNAADGSIYHQDHGQRTNAAWCFVPAEKHPGCYFILDRKHGLAIVGSDNGRIYHQALTYRRGNEVWRPEPVGDGSFFRFRDLSFHRHIVAGNAYDGRIYHQDAGDRGNGQWALALAVIGDEEPTFFSTSRGTYRLPPTQRVCHHGRFEFYCGKCSVDQRNCLDLPSSRRVVCHHGAAGGSAWQGACTRCGIDGSNCATIGLLERVVCHHNHMKSACGGCRIDGRHCVVLGPGQAVTCHHRGFTDYCGGCSVDGKNCKIVPAPIKVEIEWDTKNARPKLPSAGTRERVIVDELYAAGPGAQDALLGGELERTRAVLSPEGRPLAVGPDVLAGLPEIAGGGALVIGKPREWAATLSNPAAWTRRVEKAETVDCDEGTSRIALVASRQGVEVPFHFKIGEVRYPASLSTTDYYDAAIDARIAAEVPPEPAGEGEAPAPASVAEAAERALDGWSFRADKLSGDAGGSYHGSIMPIVLQAGGAEFLKITDAAGQGGATIDFTANLNGVSGKLSGRLSVLGGAFAFSVGLERRGFSLQWPHKSAGRTIQGPLGLYNRAVLTLAWSRFRLTFGPTIAAVVDVKGFKIKIGSVATSIITEIDERSFSQGISFKFSAIGRSYELGPFMVSIPFAAVEDLVKAFADHAADRIVGDLAESLKEAGEAAFNWVKYNVTETAEEAGALFKAVGAEASAIARGLVGTFGIAEGDAVKVMAVGAEEAERILKEAFEWTDDEVGRWMDDAGDYFKAVFGWAGKIF